MKSKHDKSSDNDSDRNDKYDSSKNDDDSASDGIDRSRSASPSRKDRKGGKTFKTRTFSKE